MFVDKKKEEGPLRLSFLLFEPLLEFLLIMWTQSKEQVIADFDQSSNIFVMIPVIYKINNVSYLDESFSNLFFHFVTLLSLKEMLITRKTKNRVLQDPVDCDYYAKIPKRSILDKSPLIK